MRCMRCLCTLRGARRNLECMSQCWASPQCLMGPLTKSCRLAKTASLLSRKDVNAVRRRFQQLEVRCLSTDCLVGASAVRVHRVKVQTLGHQPPRQVAQAVQHTYGAGSCQTPPSWRACHLPRAGGHPQHRGGPRGAAQLPSTQRGAVSGELPALSAACHLVGQVPQV